MIWKLRILGELQPCWWIGCTGRSACATRSGRPASEGGPYNGGEGWEWRILGEWQALPVDRMHRQECLCHAERTARLRRRALQRRGGMGVEILGEWQALPEQAGVPVPRGADGPPQKAGLQRRGGMGVEDFGGMASPAGGSDAQAGVPVPRGADGPPRKAGPALAC